MAGDDDFLARFLKLSSLNGGLTSLTSSIEKILAAEATLIAYDDYPNTFQAVLIYLTHITRMCSSIQKFIVVFVGLTITISGPTRPSFTTLRHDSTD